MKTILNDGEGSVIPQQCLKKLNFCREQGLYSIDGVSHEVFWGPGPLTPTEIPAVFCECSTGKPVTVWLEGQIKGIEFHNGELFLTVKPRGHSIAEGAHALLGRLSHPKYVESSDVVVARGGMPTK
ncbi:hypothetical protein SERLADRAFT_454588 [Serpula lacrymans var. lacrymans S7.9]|uniref:Uncharacterized protein n=2 Tax=Serpula lacrymans var. lacrymans TaxID=341189 RepID=F8NDL3_SERL9|nr:uncharacterized protein SERLADRAFT_454588 [Serpula lacrymans var. lacrymans S7.9]EGO30246.1 hypothetical protein SERLADRAFT_454588 [Serpula lacrymans var. lacrymans S7.9]